MTEHYQKAIAWLQAEALTTSELLQRFPVLALDEVPETIEWIIQQIEQAHENWPRTSTDTEAMLEICGDVAEWLDKPAAEREKIGMGFGFTLVPEKAELGHANRLQAEREKIGPEALQRMADVFNGPEAER